MLRINAVNHQQPIRVLRKRIGAQLQVAHQPLTIGQTGHGIEVAVGVPGIQKGGGQARQRGQRGLLLCAKGVRPGIGYAERADNVIFPRHQRRPGIKANKGRAPRQRMIAEARVQMGVMANQNLFALHRMATERLLQRRLRQRKVLSRFNVLSLFVKNRDEAAGNAQQLTGQQRKLAQDLIPAAIVFFQQFQRCPPLTELLCYLGKHIVRLASER